MGNHVLLFITIQYLAILEIYEPTNCMYFNFNAYYDLTSMQNITIKNNDFLFKNNIIYLIYIFIN